MGAVAVDGGVPSVAEPVSNFLHPSQAILLGVEDSFVGHRRRLPSKRDDGPSLLHKEASIPSPSNHRPGCFVFFSSSVSPSVALFVSARPRQNNRSLLTPLEPPPADDDARPHCATIGMRAPSVAPAPPMM